VPRREELLGTVCRLLRQVFTRPAGETSPPRVVVFAPSAEKAIDAAKRLQTALWADIEGDATAGLWGLSVLLPSAEKTLRARVSGDDTLLVLESSLRVMEMFRANQTSVLVTTAAATRGLDFPQVRVRESECVRGRGATLPQPEHRQHHSAASSRAGDSRD
jgi:hypothetical protein